jgi:hypothetical protein
MNIFHPEELDALILEKTGGVFPRAEYRHMRRKNYHGDASRVLKVYMDALGEAEGWRNANWSVDAQYLRARGAENWKAFLPQQDPHSKPRPQKPTMITPELQESLDKFQAEWNERCQREKIRERNAENLERRTSDGRICLAKSVAWLVVAAVCLYTAIVHIEDHLLSALVALAAAAIAFFLSGPNLLKAQENGVGKT